jgi:hypothetical protein
MGTQGPCPLFFCCGTVFATKRISSEGCAPRFSCPCRFVDIVATTSPTSGNNVAYILFLDATLQSKGYRTLSAWDNLVGGRGAA